MKPNADSTIERAIAFSQCESNIIRLFKATDGMTLEQHRAVVNFLVGWLAQNIEVKVWDEAVASAVRAAKICTGVQS